MKTNYYLGLLVSFVLIWLSGINSGKAQNINVTIDGHVSGYDKELSLHGPSVQELLKLDSEGKFSLRLVDVVEGKYELILGMETRMPLYFKEGTKLHLDIDFDKIKACDKKAIVITGENNDETELLNELMVNMPVYLYDRSDYKEVYLPQVERKSPKEFEAYQLSLMDKERIILKKYVDNKSIRKAFIEVYNIEQLLRYNFTFQLYNRNVKRNNPDKDWRVPAKFKSYFKNEIPQYDFNLYQKSPRYAMHVRKGYQAKLRSFLSQYSRESMDYFKANVAYLDTCTFPALIKDNMYNALVTSYMGAYDKMVKTYLEGAIYQKVIDKETLKRFEDYKAVQNTYADGKPAPQFTLIDIEGKEVSLSDFKGKMVMVDCWATWCGHCVKNLPKFNKLKEKYAGKNIVFLTISIDENVNLWKKKVKQNKGGVFTGIQLNTSINKNTFKKDFMIQGIARYILIGADGRLIRREAPRPGNEELDELIDNNLK